MRRKCEFIYRTKLRRIDTFRKKNEEINKPISNVPERTKKRLFICDKGKKNLEYYEFARKFCEAEFKHKNKRSVGYSET